MLNRPVCSKLFQWMFGVSDAARVFPSHHLIHLRHLRTYVSQTQSKIRSSEKKKLFREPSDSCFFDQKNESRKIKDSKTNVCGGVESRVFFQIIFFVGPVNFLLVLSNFRSKPFGKGFCWSRQFFARSPLGRGTGKGL